MKREVKREIKIKIRIKNKMSKENEEKKKIANLDLRHQLPLKIKKA